jgi:hypothetical protein
MESTRMVSKMVWEDMNGVMVAIMKANL